MAPSVVRIETVGGLERIGQMLVGTGPDHRAWSSRRTATSFPAPSTSRRSPTRSWSRSPGGSRSAARLVATDHSRMLVLLKVDADERACRCPRPCPQAEMRVGQWAIAVGRTFEADQPNVSVGIVSAVDRIWGKAVQTDAKISPNNYGGPLVDIHGRVLGVLVPLSPAGRRGEVAGVEWYDSGIGFAIPLEDVHARAAASSRRARTSARPAGRQPEGQRPVQRAGVIAAAAPTPAYKAGFRAGDKIVEVGGQPIARQAELKQQLGPLYAGETVRVVALRGEQRIDREVELVDKIEPYECPFLGILPMRRWRRSAADAASSCATSIPTVRRRPLASSRATGCSRSTGKKIKTRDGSCEAIAGAGAGRNGEAGGRAAAARRCCSKPQLATLPETLPGELPPASARMPPRRRGASGRKSARRADQGSGVRQRMPGVRAGGLPPGMPHGVVVWLHAPGGFKQDELVALWRPLCEKHDFILLAPQSADRTEWQPTEVAVRPPRAGRGHEDTTRSIRPASSFTGTKGAARWRTCWPC